MFRKTLLATLPALCLGAPAALAQSQDQSEAMTSAGGDAFETVARAPVMNSDGSEIGTVTINSTESDTMLVILALTEIPSGPHGVHLHETGDCSADDFSSAGGHLAGDAEHGVFVAGGPHPGDLPNAIVGDAGTVNVEYFNDRLTADMLFDDDGSAFIVHSGADDYMSQPSGDAGGRIACGEFEDVRGSGS